MSIVFRVIEELVECWQNCHVFLLNEKLLRRILKVGSVVVRDIES